MTGTVSWSSGTSPTGAPTGTVAVAAAVTFVMALTLSPIASASVPRQDTREGGTMVVHGTSETERAYRAGKAAKDHQEARAHYQRGIEVARTRLQATPDAADALLWLAANLAGEALTHGKLFALRVIPEIEATLLRLERVHPTYDNAAAARALGNLYWKAPALISVGSTKKASQYFAAALARAPDFPGNQAMAAAYFSQAGECPRAQTLARAVLRRSDLDGAYGPDAEDWRQLARDALQGCD